MFTNTAPNFRAIEKPRYPCCEQCQSLRRQSDPHHWHEMYQCQSHAFVQYGYSEHIIERANDDRRSLYFSSIATYRIGTHV